MGSVGQLRERPRGGSSAIGQLTNASPRRDRHERRERRERR